MDSPKFWAMATWFNSTVNDTPYNPAYYVPGQNTGQYQLVKLNNQSYYDTMISRLHNFDGSMATPSKAYYIEYQLPSVTGLDEPLITNAQAPSMPGDAVNRSLAVQPEPPSGVPLKCRLPGLFLPVETVPALQHYRLVHESPTDVFSSNPPGAAPEPST